MVAELGHFCLWLALALAIVQAVLPIYGYFSQRPWMVAVAKPAALMQWLFLSIGLLALAWAFYTHDFTISYVAGHSNSALPVGYRIDIGGITEESATSRASVFAVAPASSWKSSSVRHSRLSAICRTRSMSLPVAVFILAHPFPLQSRGVADEWTVSAPRADACIIPTHGKVPIYSSKLD
ncbi:MAG: hypothetical protein CVV10_09825 [Gammaproteobacteria bacterium HGW-Gammaproteobacteria-14]|nr:MAG: hypothetical protein CVV10_09825 [Gammaproteobacteria bacterium HGW-Gammaproteobacteria-14]